MVEASFMGKSGSIKMDKQQEKTLIYIAAGIVLFIIAYSVYKGVSAVETVSKPIGEAFSIISDATIGTLKTVASIGTIPQIVYEQQKEAYNTGAAAIEQSIGSPTGTYNTYLESMGLLATPLKVASALTPDILEVGATQMGFLARQNLENFGSFIGDPIGSITSYFQW